VGLSVNSQRNLSNNFLVDGFPVTDLSNRASTNPSIEAIQDMKVQVHTYDAETGRTGGGVMNMSAKSGANQFHGGAYIVDRPTSMVGELLIPKLQGQANLPEYWRDGGGGFGGPIVKNKTFFWFAGERYTDNQPQAGSRTLPTLAELSGNFNGVLKSGKQITINDPLTGLPFPNNTIPANRINPVTALLSSYFQQTGSTQIANGSPNYTATDLLPNYASQITTKIDQHFSNAVSLSGFVLHQVTHEASTNFNPDHDSSPQLSATASSTRSCRTMIRNQPLHRADGACRLQPFRRQLQPERSQRRPLRSTSASRGMAHDVHRCDVGHASVSGTSR
jgi:hypothetical protein